MKRVGMITTLVFIVLIIFWVRLAAAQKPSPTSPAVPETPAAATPLAPAFPTRGMVPTPTVDRLAAPPTVENPTQADEGAQLFWLHCQPCHGDQGQGLTDEWRAQYPEEDQNCWTSGCHGDRPYENGFTLPTRVPAVIGDQSLERFETMGQVYVFMRAAMPFQDPGHLTQEEFLAITAFLARAHGFKQNGRLTAEDVHDLRLKPAPTATSTAASGSTEILLPTISTSQESPVNQLIPFGVAAGIMVLLMAVGGVWLWRRNKL